MDAAWVAGDWELLSDGLRVIGNDIDAPPLDNPESEEEPQQDSPFVERLNSARARQRIITQREAEELLAVVHCDASWDAFHRDEFLEVQRHKDRGLFGGAVFVKISGCFPGTTVDHVAHCYMNFKDRAKWDKQMDGFQVLNHSKGNDLLYSVIHSPPLSDRDFVVFHTVLRHRSRSGLMFYSRSADDSFYPKQPGAVRATQFMAAHQLIQEAGGVRFMTATAIDPHIAFLPRWVLSWLLPSEFKRWRSSVLRRCGELRGQSVPCSVLWAEDVEGPEVFAENKASLATLSTGVPSDENVLHDILIEDNEQVTCCC